MSWVRRGTPLRPARCPPGTVLRDTTIESVSIAPSRETLADVTIERCIIDDLRIGAHVASVDRLLRVERVRLKDVTFRARPFLGPAFWDSCVLDGAKVGYDVGFFRGFHRHCVLRGRIGKFIFFDEIGVAKLRAGTPPSRPPSAMDIADARRAVDMVERYRTLDWALDIRHAQFVEPMSFHLPGRLVRHDPDTQVAVSRDRLRAYLEPDLLDWRKLGPNPWVAGMNKLFDSPFESCVLAAPAFAKDRDWWLDGVHDFRRRGLADEPLRQSRTARSPKKSTAGPKPRRRIGRSRR